jgi:membrane protease YdiL (CAAX protease family)
MSNTLKSFFTSRLSNSVLSLFEFRKFGILSGRFQVLLVILLWLASLFLGYREFLSKGTFQGYLPSDAFSLINVPIWEEFIFRGLILGSLWKHNPAWVAIGISSLLFGLRHLLNLFYGGNISGVLDQVFYTAVVFSPVAAFLTIKSKSVWPAVIFHFLHNLILLYF